MLILPRYIPPNKVFYLRYHERRENWQEEFCRRSEPPDFHISDLFHLRPLAVVHTCPTFLFPVVLLDAQTLPIKHRV
jgi:hypothetical protein